MMISLDGYFEGPNHDLSWHNVDEEFNAFAIDQTSKIDTLIFGRRTYELMANYWPKGAALEDDPVVAKQMNDMPKVVFSSTLERVDWQNSRLATGNLKDEILNLKKQAGNSLAVFGSNNLCVSLLDEGLLDEIRVIVNPVVIGAGTPLFAGIKRKLDLQLVGSRQFTSGNQLLTYRPKVPVD